MIHLKTMKINKKEKMWNDAFMSCYQRLFEKSTPSGDFNKMLEEAELDQFGRKVIPFMDYEIDHDLLEQIIIDTYKESKIHKKDFEVFRRSILLGCSPKSKYKE